MEELNIEKFIEIIKNNPILWDLTNPQYKNAKRKAQIWKNISQECGQSIEICKKKWKGLQDSYTREKNHRRRVSGQEAGDIEPGWKYFKQMEFLADHLKPRMTTSNYEEDIFAEQTTEEETQSTSQDERLTASTSRGNAGGSGFDVNVLLEEAVLSSPACSSKEVAQTFSPVTRRGDDSSNTNETSKDPTFVSPTGASSSSVSRTRRKVHNEIEEKLVGTMATLQEFIKKRRQDEASVDDEDELFCRSLVSKIKKFPLVVKNEAKEFMLKYLNEIEQSLQFE